MEPEHILNNNNSLGEALFSELSNVDLDDLLQFNSQPLQLPSSFNTAAIKVEPQSQPIISQEISKISSFPFPLKNEVLSPASFCVETSRQQHQNSENLIDLFSNSNVAQDNVIADSFAEEFARFQAEDFDLPALDEEFENINLPNKAKSNNIEKPKETPNLNISCTIFEPGPNAIKTEPVDYISFSCNSNSISQEISTERSTGSEQPVADAPELLRNLAAADASMMPASIKQLYDVIKQQYSDFAFIYALSAQLCQNRVPMDSFVQLKLALLLSLASIGTNPDVPPIPIIAIGNDTYMANYLLMQIGELAPRFIGPELDLKAPVPAALPGGSTWIEADALLLAKGGVYFAGDWAHLKAARAEQLYKTIECARVHVSNINYPLQTAIWAHWRSFKFNAKEQQSFNKFIKIFGIPIYIDDENHEVLINCLLEQSSVQLFESTIDHLSINEEDMRQYVALVSQRTVDLQAEAATLLQQYFVASRCQRPDCLSQHAFVVLKQFAESFAKLSFRHEVNNLDALAAIYICENFKQKFFGPGQHPAPAFETHNYVWLVDGQLAQFREWLQEYLNRYYKQNNDE